MYTATMAGTLHERDMGFELCRAYSGTEEVRLRKLEELHEAARELEEGGIIYLYDVLWKIGGWDEHYEQADEAEKIEMLVWRSPRLNV